MRRRDAGEERGTLRIAALLAGALALGCCGGPAGERRGERLRGEEAADLLALLPAGQDIVLDVDVGLLRRLDGAARLLAELPEGVQRSLAVLSAAPLLELDALCAGVIGLGTPEVDVVLVARGRMGREHPAQALLARAPGAGTVEYHGVSMLESDVLALALLGERTAVLGSRIAVRQVIDNFHGDSDGVRTQPELMAALAHAPRARTGRPAIMMAAVPPQALRERLRQADLGELGADARYVAASLAVGDGLDLGVVAGYQELPIARDVAQRLLDRAAALRRRPALVLLGVERLVDPLIVVAAPSKKGEPEVHIAYRLPGTELTWLLGRLDEVRRLKERMKAPRP